MKNKGSRPTRLYQLGKHHGAGDGGRQFGYEYCREQRGGELNLRGAPLVAVGSITNRPAMSLFVQPEITKPEQLQGKTLAITRHGSSTHFLTVCA